MGLITPTLPTSGEDRGTEEVDALNALQTIVNVINGNLDSTNLAAGPFAPYDAELGRGQGLVVNADSTTLKFIEIGGTNRASGATVTLPAQGIFVPSSNPWTLAGKTPKIRLSAGVGCNNVAPGAGTLAASLRPVTYSGTGGAFVYTLGAALVSTSAITPVQAGYASGVSSDVDVPAAGFYAFCFQMTSAVAANAVLNVDFRAELHHV